MSKSHAEQMLAGKEMKQQNSVSSRARHSFEQDRSAISHVGGATDNAYATKEQAVQMHSNNSLQHSYTNMSHNMGTAQVN